MSDHDEDCPADHDTCECNPPTIVAPCPAFDRLDEIMSHPGKRTSDATNPAQFHGIWPHRRREAS